MKVQTTVILLIILAALGGYVYWSGQNNKEDADTGADTAMTNDTSTVPVLRFDTSAIHAIEVSNTNSGEYVRAEKQHDTWTLTGMITDTADAVKMTRAITDLSKLNATRIITPSDEDIPLFALTPPLHEVVLQDAEGEMVAQLHLGAKNPTGGSTYVQRDDEETIYLISDFVINTLEGWLSTPPVQPTPTPTATPSPTPLPPTPTEAISATHTMEREETAEAESDATAEPEEAESDATAEPEEETEN